MMDINEIIKPENKVYGKTPILKDNILHYCPGCSHGVVHKIIAEVIEEMGIQDKTIGISPVGCSVFAYNYLDIDWQQAAHGRAPALATATKRLMPDKYVFTYQGDGDLASIGTAEVMHACNRGENIVIIFINNAGNLLRDPSVRTEPRRSAQDQEGHPQGFRELHDEEGNFFRRGGQHM